MEWDGLSSLANFIARFKEWGDDIVRSGGYLEEQTIANKLMAALPDSWVTELTFGKLEERVWVRA